MNREHNHISDDLLVKRLLGEATADEIADVNAWLQENEANRKYYENFKIIWDTSKRVELKSSVDADVAWQRFKQKSESSSKPSLPKTIPLNSRMSWVRIAAILILFVGVGWSLLYYGGYVGSRMIYVHADNDVVNHTLTDGTTITLNKGATLHYPKRFKGDTRTVKLDGEAFFNVAPDKSKPFIINIDKVSVEVVGTSFNVKGTAKEVEVIVETGIVEVAKKKNAVTLKPNEKVTVQKNSDKLVKEDVTDELYNYYRTREFICNGTPLWRLVEVLNEAYNADIRIANPSIANRQLTTTFHNETLDNIISVAAETLDIEVEKHGTEIILK